MTTEEMVFLRELDKKVDKIIGHITKIDTVLFDTEGNLGLCSKVESIDRRVTRNSNFLIVLAVTAGTSLGGFIKTMLGR